MSSMFDREIESFEDYQLDPSELSEARQLQERSINQGDTRGITVKTNIERDKSNKHLKSQFVLAFTDNLFRLSQLDISKNQLKVICYILTKMEYGNLITLQQSSIASALELHKSNVSRIFKQLKEKAILVEDEDKNLFINSNLFSKGLYHRLEESRRENLRKARKDTCDFQRSFDL